jgi:DNA invertase Pin-like site-specific DNA recombinase
MLTVLGGLAEFETDLIRTRTGEGRKRAKARGVKLGRQTEIDRTPEPKAIRPATKTASRDTRLPAATMLLAVRFRDSQV